MMTQGEQQLLVERLLEALHRHLVIVELVNRFPGQQRRWVKHLSTPRPAITARVRDYQRSANGPWLYWWTWWQPVRTVGDMERVTNTFCDVVQALAGEQ